MTINHGVSLVGCLVLCSGFLMRRDRSRHIPLMVVAIVIDFSLVIYLEITRMAVEKSLGLAGFPLPGPLLSVHIVISVTVLLLYIFQIVTGIRLKNGDETVRLFHRRGGYCLLTVRLANFITSLLIS